MPRDRKPDDRARGRFSRSGHTAHHQTPPAAAPPPLPPPTPPPPPAPPPPPPYHQPTFHDTRPPATEPGRLTVTRAVAHRGNQFARAVTNKVISASKSDGADESGLTPLIWNQVLSYGADAMITVALAGTVFFSASADAKRGNVLLYLLVTMAPFAIVAPIIGPALDRVQHGRRWAMAATGIGRAVLAIIMAGHPTTLFVLYPCALGSLVLSKAYSVMRAAAAPRLVPRGLTLVETNARLSTFGLVAALVGGGFVGLVIKASGSYSAGLWVTAIAFGACAYFAFKLPKQVDSASPLEVRPEQQHPPAQAMPPTQQPVQAMPPSGRVARLGDWARRGFAPQVITALQGESMLRFLSGFLTIYIAFYVESTRHGFSAALALGGVAVGVGAGNVLGNFSGTGIGTRRRLGRPERLIVIGCGVAAAVCLLTAVFFGLTVAIMCMFISAVVNSLAKIALDAVIQRDVPETLRSSAFARSETFLQLAWVLGAAIGVLLPAHDGALGFWVAGGVVGAATVVVVLHNRAMRRAAPPPRSSRLPGSLARDQPQP